MRAREFVSETADAKSVLDYIHQTHHEPLTPKLQKAVLAHPSWRLTQVPLSSLHIPDQEYDDEEQEPESDPYNRVQAIDPDHAGEYSANFVDRRPIVVDSQGWIIDGNHRAWAAAELLNRDSIQAWVPVKSAVSEGRGVKQEIEEFLYSLSPDDVGVEEFPGYRIHYEGFTDDCKSSSDYQRNPNRVYKQVYQDFIDREGGRKPAKSGMVGDEEYPILYSVFKVPQSKTIDTAEKAYNIAYKKKQPWPRGSREEKLIRSNWQLSGLYDQYVLNKQNITEAFDQPYAIQWTKQNGDWHATADLDDGSELVVLFMSQGDNQWMVEFERDENMEITGEGDAQRVFATVLTAMRQFIGKRKPAMLNFSAEKEDDPTGSRARLYDRMIQRYVTGTGYDLTREDMPGGATYTLTKQVQDVAENFADGKVRGKSRPGRVKRAGASCDGSVSSLRAKAKKYGGERGKMYHWCANMKAGRKK